MILKLRVDMEKYIDYVITGRLYDYSDVVETDIVEVAWFICWVVIITLFVTWWQVPLRWILSPLRRWKFL